MYSRTQPSKDYVELLEEYKDLHKDPKYFKGICLVTHLNTVGNIMLKEGAKSLLDYGCGKGILYHETKCRTMKLNEKGQALGRPLQKIFNLDYYALYDPAYPEHNKLPKGKYDAVICTDVIEHIDEKDVDWILEEIFSYARKFVLLTIACYKALKTFKDGRNVHVNVKPQKYWQEKLLQLHNKHSHLNIHYSLDVLEDENAENPTSITKWETIERK